MNRTYITQERVKEAGYVYNGCGMFGWKTYYKDWYKFEPGMVGPHSTTVSFRNGRFMEVRLNGHPDQTITLHSIHTMEQLIMLDSILVRHVKP